MKLMVTGGRDYADDTMLRNTLDEIHHQTPVTVLIHGANKKGADRLAKLWAETNKIECKPFPADWKKFHKAAGPIRNQEMVDDGPHLVVAFPGANGTADAVMRARRRGIPVMMVT